MYNAREQREYQRLCVQLRNYLPTKCVVWEETFSFSPKSFFLLVMPHKVDDVLIPGVMVTGCPNLNDEEILATSCNAAPEYVDSRFLYPSCEQRSSANHSTPLPRGRSWQTSFNQSFVARPTFDRDAYFNDVAALQRKAQMYMAPPSPASSSATIEDHDSASDWESSSSTSSVFSLASSLASDTGEIVPIQRPSIETYLSQCIPVSRYSYEECENVGLGFY
ncbi:hypothetical protein BT69DRAFT_1378067 [Atractiella rhizophila]|nr:hypothetical protein BT69DRAFT_1378067 [Atractiella rhizophila]